MKRIAWCLVAALSLAQGCGGDGSSMPAGPTGPTVAGMWTGTVSVPFAFTAVIDFDLDETASGRVSGTVTASGLTDAPVSGPISGTHVFPSLMLGLSTEALGDVTYEGVYDGVATIDGTISVTLPDPRSLPLTMRRP